MVSDEENQVDTQVDNFLFKKWQAKVQRTSSKQAENDKQVSQKVKTQVIQIVDCVFHFKKTIDISYMTDVVYCELSLK